MFSCKLFIHLLLSLCAFLIGYNLNLSQRRASLQQRCILTNPVELETPCAILAENITNNLNCNLPMNTKIPYIHNHVHAENRGVLDTVFEQLHHPATPSPGAELFLTLDAVWPSENPVSSCSQVFVTRTGQRSTDGYNKCVALAVIDSQKNSPYFQTHRYGTSGRNLNPFHNITNKYQADYGRKPSGNMKLGSYVIEENFLSPFLNERDSLREEFLRLTGGSPFDSQGNRKLVLIMVTNNGHLDLLLNFMCSIRAANIKIDEMIGNML